MKTILRTGPKNPKKEIQEKLVPNLTYRCTCNHCDSQFEYQTEDLESGWTSGLTLVICPVCKNLRYQNFIQRWWNRYCPPVYGDYPGP